MGCQDGQANAGQGWLLREAKQPQTGTGRDACTETDNVAGGIAMGTEALEVVSTLFGGEGGAVAGMAVGACGDVSALVSESEMANFAASSACARIYVSQVS